MSKLIKGPALTEREWDHVVLSLETSAAQLTLQATKAYCADLPGVATDRAAKRFISVASKLSKHLGWDGV